MQQDNGLLVAEMSPHVSPSPRHWSFDFWNGLFYLSYPGRWPFKRKRLRNKVKTPVNNHGLLPACMNSTTTYTYKSRSRRADRTSRCFQHRLLSTIKDCDTHKFRHTCVILWLTVICHMQHPDLRLCVAQRTTYRRRWYAWSLTKQVIVYKLVSRRKEWALCCGKKNNEKTTTKT